MGKISARLIDAAKVVESNLEQIENEIEEKDHLNHRINKMELQVQNQEEVYSKAMENYQELENEVDSLKLKLNSAKDQNVEDESTIESLNAKIAELELETTKEKSTVKHLEGRLASQTERLETLEKDLEERDDKLRSEGGEEGENNILLKQISQLKATLVSINQADELAKKEALEMEHKISELESELDQERDKTSKNKKKIRSLEEELELIKEENHKLNQKIEELSKQPAPAVYSAPAPPSMTAPAEGSLILILGETSAPKPEAVTRAPLPGLNRESIFPTRESMARMSVCNSNQIFDPSS